MVIYELRKILSQRTVSVLLTALLLLYTALFSSFALELKDKTIPADKTQEFLMLYYNDSQSVEKVFEERQKLIDEYWEITKEMTRAEAEAYGPLVLGNVYIDSSSYTDDDLKLILDERLEYCAAYKQSIADVISGAKINLEEALSGGESPDSYYCAYEKQIAGQYEKVLNRAPAIGFEYVHGWDTLFLSDMIDLFLVISIILIGATVFSLERESGTLGVLRVSKKGRAQTAKAKLLALVLVVILLVLIYVGVTALVIGLTLGFSSGLNYIQAISQFLYAPFALTMFEYLWVFAGMKILVLTVLALAAALISQLSNSAELTYVCLAALYGGSFLFNILPNTHFSHYLGFGNALRVSLLFERVRLTDVFGRPMSYISVAVAVFAFMALVLAISAHLLYCTRAAGVFKRLDLGALVDKLKAKIPRVSVAKRKYPSSLYGFESYKRFVASNLVFVFALLIVLQFAVSYQKYDLPLSQSEELYLSYLENVKGEHTQSSADFIEKEGKFILDSMSSYKEADSAYTEGLISKEEYKEAERNYFYSLYHWSAFQKLSTQQDYILEQKDNGNQVHFIATRPWNTFFTSGAGYLLPVFLVLLSASIFSGEYRGAGLSDSFASILRTTRHGRRRTFAVKYTLVLLSSVVGAFVFAVFDIAVFARTIGISDLKAPLASAESFANMNSDITLGGYLALHCVTVIVFSALFALAVCSISQLTRNTAATLCISGVMLFVPDVISGVGLEFADYFNFMSGISGHKLWLNSCEADLWQNSFALGLVTGVILLICVALLGIAAYSKYNKT